MQTAPREKPLGRNSRSELIGLRVPLPIVHEIDRLVDEATGRGIEGCSRSETMVAILWRHFGLAPPRPEVLGEKMK